MDFDARDRMSLDQARQLVIRHVGTAYPQVCAALLTGSVVRGTATPTSDVDVVVFLPDGAGARRDTVSWEGISVDVFGYDPAGLDRWLPKDTERRRPVLSSLILDGVLVTGDPAIADRAKTAAAKILAAGPRPTNEAELTRMRYGVTDLLLDIEGSADRAETLLLAGQLVQSVGDLLLATDGRWTGAGKWLLRELRAYDRELAADLSAAHDDLARMDLKQPLVRMVDNILARHGGRYLVGRSDQG